MKLGGIVLGLHEGFQAAPDSRVIALAALMLAGAQISETVLLAVLERVFGTKEKE